MADDDAAVAPELDSFNLTFPLPYRVGFLFVMGIWGWGVNLQYLERARINVPSLIKYPARSSPTEPSHHFSTYRLAVVTSFLYALSITTFWVTSARTTKYAVQHDWIPMLFLVGLVGIFFAPLRHFVQNGRSRFLNTMKRISIGGIAELKDGKFGDILLADALVSYARVFGDLFVALCMFLAPGTSSTAIPNRRCGGLLMVPLITAIPSAIRLRQCLIEYKRVRSAPYKESTGWGGQHLANAAKYSTAFPVIIFTTWQRGLDHYSPSVFAAWVIAAFINSCYSFYWDVAKDWDLTLFSNERSARDHPFGLRKKLVFRAPILYYFVILMDLVLRFTWMVKLTHHLDRVADLESSVFLLQFLEVFRRWVWIFFRVETEFVRTAGSTGLGVDDILLGDFQGKYDDSEDDMESS